MRSGILKPLMLLICTMIASGCGTVVPYDYTAYKQSNPRSILVLPPVNNTPDIAATYGMLSQVTYPLAESGYYVFPVTLVDETFKQNGLMTPADIHTLAPNKLREIFGADVGLYITVTQYGTAFNVLSSETRVSAKAKLVDLRTGFVLWDGAATASSNENRNLGSGGLTGGLLTAVVNQIVENVMDASQHVAAKTSVRLLSAGSPNGLLYGPRSPKYNQSQ